MERIAVVGAGQMGAGIAHVAALAGLEVSLYDQDTALPTRAIEAIGAQAGEEVRSRLHAQTEIDLTGAEIVIEAVSERQSLKCELFRILDARAEPGAILASNTSSISITSIAAATEHPARVVGMHFMNPVPLMRLVEVVRGQRTSDETIAAVDRLARLLGKTPVTVADVPGFVSNRVLMPMINEAISALYEGVADVEGIDTVMRLGMNHPLGPLALADLIGLDTCLSVLEVLLSGFGDPRYRASPLLRRYVAAGRLGRKSGEGFYQYSPEGKRLKPSEPRG